MRRSGKWVLAAACALVIANNYYNQPLLADFARTFQVTEREAGGASIVTQGGYALGMLAFLPLGDMIDRRLLINALLRVRPAPSSLPRWRRRCSGCWLRVSPSASPASYPRSSFPLPPIWRGRRNADASSGS